MGPFTVVIFQFQGLREMLCRPVVPVGRALRVWQTFAGNDGQCLDSCLHVYDNQIILVNRFSIKL